MGALYILFPTDFIMSEESSERRVNLRNLNWFGKTVYLGGTVLRLTANLVDAAADRATAIADESKKAFERELDPNVEDARVIEEYSRSDRTWPDE